MLSVRELTAADVPLLADYWASADKDYLLSMGALIEKIPPRENLAAMLGEQLLQSYPDKRSYAIIWLIDGQPVGHCNVNNIEFGNQASMHLHMWNGANRKKGSGAELVKMTLPWFFNNLQLQKIICEPYALNEAPNRTLEKIGFDLVKEYITTPGYLNFEQPVKQWEMWREKFLTI